MLNAVYARLALGIAAGLACIATPITAQVPGLPTLQNAFGNPGIAIAANAGSSFLGLAGAFGMGSGKLTISAGAGMQTANGSHRGAYGGRAAMSLWTSAGGSLGAGAFVGAGGAPQTRLGAVTTNGAEFAVPAGISLGYRRAMGPTRGISAFVSPLYRWARVDTGAVASSAVSSSGSFRVATGVDLALSPSFGVSAGVELGAKAKGTRQSTLFGGAITYALGGGRR